MGYRRRRRHMGALGRTIRAIRKRCDLSQSQLAALLGWTPHLVPKYETGCFKPSTERLIQLLRLANPAERGVILRTLQDRGVVESDLAPAPSATAPVCAGDIQSAMSGGLKVSDSDREAAAVADGGEVEIGEATR